MRGQGQKQAARMDTGKKPKRRVTTGEKEETHKGQLEARDRSRCDTITTTAVATQQS